MDAKLINSTTDLVALVPGLRRSGQYHIGPCPFCGGDDRFTIKRTDAGDLWLCRKCGDGKYHDAVAFRMKAEGRSFREVVGGKGEGEKGGMGISPAPLPPFSPSPGQDSELVTQNSSLVTPPDEAWQIARLVDQKRLADNLWLVPGDDPAAPAMNPETAAVVWHYLRAYRGLTPDTIRRAMLGYNPDGTLLADGSAYPPGLHIPCMVDGQLWYVKARLPKWALAKLQQVGRRQLPKYLMLRGSRTALFNADALLGARVAVVTEGEFDALLLGQFLPDGWAAVTMGGAGLLPDERFLPYFSGLERVVLAMDSDSAGRKALAAWRKLLRWAEPAPPLPPGVKDLTDFWRNKGDFGQWLQL